MDAPAAPVMLELRRHTDPRGWLVETLRAEALQAAGLPVAFAQENLSRSAEGVLRGLHFQDPEAQGKLLLVLQGTIFDAAVDLRAGPDFGRVHTATLSADAPRLLWVPEGFAHGFYVTRGPALVLYKLTRPWAPAAERCLRWDDPDLRIPWPLSGPPHLSEKDSRGQLLAALRPLGSP